MLRNLSLTLVLSFACAWAQPAIPDTPAGRVLRAWFEAFNSGDRGRIEAYLKQYDPDKEVEGQLSFRQQTGGFDLVSIDKSEPTQIAFHVKEKGGPTTALGKLALNDAAPPRVSSFSIRALPPGAKVEDVVLDSAARARVIEGAAKMLDEYYVYPDIAKKMEEAVRDRQQRGQYDTITDGDAFAQKLTADLREVSHDRHLGVNYSPAVLPPDRAGAAPTAEQRDQMRKQMERMNCGFEKVERLQPNIGYLKFNGFADPDVCGPTATAAMNFLGNVDALIIDLRENGGGDPRMVAYVSSYLFDDSTHLNDLYNRKEDSTTQYWTLPYVPGKRLAGKPVYILTAKRTFSGAEEFTYNLKNLKRATIIGETTGGGAHPVSGHRIDDHFTIGVPFARAVNPVSKTNWEGTGVEPDIKAPAGEALDVAKKMAAEEIRKK